MAAVGAGATFVWAGVLITALCLVGFVIPSLNHFWRHDDPSFPEERDERVIDAELGAGTPSPAAAV